MLTLLIMSRYICLVVGDSVHNCQRHMCIKYNDSALGELLCHSVHNGRLAANSVFRWPYCKDVISSPHRWRVNSQSALNCGSASIAAAQAQVPSKCRAVYYSRSARFYGILLISEGVSTVNAANETWFDLIHYVFIVLDPAFSIHV